MKPTFFSRCMGIHLRKMRLKHKKTITSLVLKSGLSRSYIIALENGEAELTVYNLYQLANGIGVQPSELVDGD